MNWMPIRPARFARILCPAVLLVAGWLVATGSARGLDRAEILAAIHSITTEEVKTTVEVLADDSFEGREAGSRGGRAAGNYLMKEFEKLGLSPAGDGKTYFQAFNGTSRNILGLLEGSDPNLKEEIIVVGAHYDHVGYGRPTNSFGPFGFIHNGADDNASGVSGLLEIIGAMRHLPTAPRRSILFALWDAEEQGLLGSQHWLNAPTLPVSRVVCAINMDMIGRLRDSKLEVLGCRTGTSFRRIISEANSDTGLALDFSWKMKADSDHWPFFTRSIPSLMFHTGLHGEYHRPSDDTHTINNEGIAQVTRVAFLTALELANREQLGGFRAASRGETVSHQAAAEQPVQPQAPRFGLPLRVEAGDPPKFVLTSVPAGSAAEKGGLLAGDRLLELNGQAIRDEKRMRLELLAAEGETQLLIERPGQDLPLSVKLMPLGPPIRVGITWRWDEAEPGSVLITQVVYGSAAHGAGLAVRDRIHSVSGQQFASSEAFGGLLTSLSGPLEMRVERGGRMLTLPVEVLK
ncbi:MAG: M28 family peptidase [Pirellulaceae bacterium]|nr:M28 family peptidase [Pirellulaceae bacterium]